MVCGQAAQVDVGEPGSDRFSVSTWVANRGERNALVQRLPALAEREDPVAAGCLQYEWTRS